MPRMASCTAVSKRSRLVRKENAQPRKIVLHGQQSVGHGAAIARDGSLVCRLGGLDFGMALSEIRHRLGAGRADRPDLIGAVQRGPAEAIAKAHAAPDNRESSEVISRNRYAELRRSAALHGAFSGGDVGAALQQRGRAPPPGTAGNIGTPSLCGISRSSGFLPTSTAMAWSILRARDAETDEQGLRAVSSATLSRDDRRHGGVAVMSGHAPW